GKKSAQIREILISESAWEEMTCLFAPSLNHIFPLPTGDIFSNRMVWFEDKQILSEIVIMRGIEPARWNTPLPLTVGKNETINATHDGRHWRRYPEPHRLTTREEQA
ncbi:TPA: BcsE family c-di-GMP-binding protein, partial [Klebsiella pneumoniae]